jgi:hypothetical protein
MKKLLVYATGLLTPIAGFASEWDVPIVNDPVAYASVFSGDFSFLLSIVIGIIATFFVFRAALKMGGGLFGSVLKFIGTGMIFIVIGTISVIAASWISDIWFRVVHTVFFALGYIFMVVGANKLLKGLINS